VTVRDDDSSRTRTIPTRTTVRLLLLLRLDRDRPLRLCSQCGLLLLLLSPQNVAAAAAAVLVLAEEAMWIILCVCVGYALWCGIQGSKLLSGDGQSSTCQQIFRIQNIRARATGTAEGTVAGNCACFLQSCQCTLSELRLLESFCLDGCVGFIAL
jgi:hypothetical protein